MVTDDTNYAPGFYAKSAVKKATQSDILVQWYEWINSSALGTKATLPATADSSNVYKIGAYAVTGAEVYLNPLKT